MVSAGIDWQRDAEAAFAQAHARGLPLLLYWGAAWCPPCNRIKSVVFGRPDFTALSDSFVALAIDGDSAGAQRLAERLGLRSYPTLVVYRPDGAEITRLPCELDGKRFVHILALALNARYTAAESLSVALSRERALSDDEWRLLSFYSWDTDERQLLKNLDFAAIVASLTRACSLPEATMRLEWLGLHAAAMAGETGVDQAAAIARLETTLNDPHVVCEQLDIVIGYALDLVRFLTAPGSVARLALIASWSRARNIGARRHP
jgi:thiol-disulfide isomerase/thioredoxin